MYYSDILGFGTAMFAVMIFLGVLWCLQRIFPKSREYRKYLTNLFVAAKIRKLAEKENLILEDEEKTYVKYAKISNKKYLKELDDRIEQDLIDKIDLINDKPIM